MSTQGFSIAEAANASGLSTRTIRRFIKAGKIRAELVPGQFGEEYRIPELPPELRKNSGVNSAVVQPSAGGNGQTSVQSPLETGDIIRELQDKNLALAAQLGAATERIRNLENQMKLLTAPRKPWWRRLFSRT